MPSSLYPQRNFPFPLKSWAGLKYVGGTGSDRIFETGVFNDGACFISKKNQIKSTEPKNIVKSKVFFQEVHKK